MGQTLSQKVWSNHVVRSGGGQPDLLYIDLHLVHEVTSPQAFDGLRMSGRGVRRPDLTVATEDHNVPTADVDKPIADETSRKQIETLRTNTDEFAITNFPMGHANQGIVHVIGPELGLTQPGMTVVCGDSHTSTHGAFGALAFGIGTSEVEHVLATQTLPQAPQETMAITINGELPEGSTAKDVVLAVLGAVGTGGGIGAIAEFRGPVIEALSMEGRMTVCNMSIEFGAKAGLIAPDATTLDYLKGRPNAPQGTDWDAAVAAWSELRSDDDAVFDREVVIEGATITPHVTWGTNPGQVIPFDGHGARSRRRSNPRPKKTQPNGHWSTWVLTAGTPMTQRQGRHGLHRFSCTNSRIEDLRSAAAVAKGRKVADGMRTLVVPGSGLVEEVKPKQRVSTKIFIEAGFDWREARVLHVFGHEPRQAHRRRTLGQHQQPQFRRAPRPRRPHALGVARSRRRNRYRWHVRFASRPVEAQIMQPVHIVQGTAVPLDRSDVDTDQIIPSDWLKRVERTGFEKGLFSEWRDEPSFVLNSEAYAGASILIGGPNFGTGSSREHAVWAIQQYGFEAVISPRFGPIFRNNSTKNGLVPVEVSAEIGEKLLAAVQADPSLELTIDVERKTLEAPTLDLTVSFELDDSVQERFLKGLDDIGITMMADDAINTFESSRPSWLPAQ